MENQEQSETVYHFGGMAIALVLLLVAILMGLSILYFIYEYIMFVAGIENVTLRGAAIATTMVGIFFIGKQS